MRVHDQAAAAVSFYARPAAMTSAGRYAPLLEILPRDIPGLAAVAQGLLIHEHLAQAYGVTLSETDRVSVHTVPPRSCWRRSWPATTGRCTSRGRPRPGCPATAGTSPS